jgi:hypothetical protein
MSDIDRRVIYERRTEAREIEGITVPAGRLQITVEPDGDMVASLAVAGELTSAIRLGKEALAAIRAELEGRR